MGGDNGQTQAMIPAGSTHREEFGVQQFSVAAEMATAAIAAQQRALVEAKFIMAERRPRDIDRARERILQACRRSGFAEQALYRRPVGRDRDGKQAVAVGLSIRAAEEAIRDLGNIDVSTMILWDDEGRRTLQVSVLDLETCTSYSGVLSMEKTVERSSVRDGQEVLGKRLNSYGRPVYLVRATEDELLVKQAAAVSKAIRTLGLRLVPGDILEDMRREVERTLTGQTEDREAARKRLIDAFGSINVSVAQLRDYLGHDLSEITHDEVVLLRQVWATIRDGEATWREYAAEREAERAAQAPPQSEQPAPAVARQDSLAQKVAAKTAAVQQRQQQARPAEHPQVLERALEDLRAMDAQIEDLRAVDAQVAAELEAERQAGAAAPTPLQQVPLTERRSRRAMW